MNARGISLLETLLYLGLFACVMEGGFAGMFALVESANRQETLAYITEEGNFIADKISYEISQSEMAHVFASEGGTEIDLTNLDGVTNIISFSDDTFFIQRESDIEIPFSSNLVHISKVAFAQSDSSSTDISIAFTVNAKTRSGQLVSVDVSRVAYLDL